MPNFISEDQIEKAAVSLLTGAYGYRAINCHTSDVENPDDQSNRTTKQEVVFMDILKTRAARLNPALPAQVIEQALDTLTKGRYAMPPVLANKEVYGLLRDGIPVQYAAAGRETGHGIVRVIDFTNPGNNDFLVAAQLWIKGSHYPRRPDLLIYINGIPLVFIELKNSNVKVQNAYDDNLANYKRDIPLLFNYNAFCILSNGIETKVGSFTAGYEFFFSWLRPDNEAEPVDKKSIEQEGTSLERVIHGLLSRERLLDYIENFMLYYKDSTKIIAQNHQFIGVNKALESFHNRAGKKGKLGVFWHTQGAGKSFSMIFLARKIFRKCTGNYTFVIITDREDLDGQIYRNFLDTETVDKTEAAQPKNSGEMHGFLGRNLRLIFTLIQKFRFDKGKEYPVLSTRDDIIVIVDEAHRTQYAALAENMHKGLPNAQYFAFTGTPLLGRDGRQHRGKTYDWFGGYVSRYNFIQSIDDGATVPLFYRKRVPEVLIQNENLSAEFYQILEDENLDAKNQEKLEKEFATEMEVITREDRLETIARDIAAHFPNRGYLGKGMCISVDKFTCVKMYDKVQAHWKETIKQLVGAIGRTANAAEKERLQQQLAYMRSVEMAVVISEEAGEEERFTRQKLDIKPHRARINAIDENGHDIEYRFKDKDDKLQLVFVCAMWLTGFDAPTVSTLYLDKPLKDHTLMQTIARANRVTAHTINGIAKKNGEIIDYYNVFRNMEKALSDYAFSDDQEQEAPLRDKSCLFDLLDDALRQGTAFCTALDIDLNPVLDAKAAFNRLKLFESFADKLLAKDTYWKEFKVYENTISALYEACKPEILGTGSRPLVFVFQYLRGVVESSTGRADIESVKLRIGDLLDQSIVTAGGGTAVAETAPGYNAVREEKFLNLALIDFEKLKAEFKTKEFKHIEIANLRQFIEKKLADLINENSTRTDFAVKLREIIDRYNSGGMLTEDYFDELVRYAAELKTEEERHVREGLTKDELEIFDILKKDKMTKAETVRVKNAAKHLLKRLTAEQPRVLVQDWFKDTQSQVKVKTAIDEVLDTDLPETYGKALFRQKSRKLYELIYEYASRGFKWAA